MTTETNTNPNDQGGSGESQKGGEESLLSGTDGQSNEGGAGTGTNDGTGAPKDGSGTGAVDDYAGLKLPEGADVDQKFFTGVKAWAKEHGIKADGLQKLVDSWGERFKEAKQESDAKYKEERGKMVQGWVKSLREDKDFGGQSYNENVTGVRSFLAKVDPDKVFRKELVAAGIDNWPPLVKFLHGLAKASKDDSVAGTLENTPKTAANDDQAFYDEMYPSMKKAQ